MAFTMKLTKLKKCQLDSDDLFGPKQNKKETIKADYCWKCFFYVRQLMKFLDAIIKENTKLKRTRLTSRRLHFVLYEKGNGVHREHSRLHRILRHIHDPRHTQKSQASKKSCINGVVSVVASLRCSRKQKRRKRERKRRNIGLKDLLVLYLAPLPTRAYSVPECLPLATAAY